MKMLRPSAVSILVCAQDTLVDLYFISDIVLNFRTAFVNPKGIRETAPRAIAK